MGWVLMKSYNTANASKYSGGAERTTFEFEYQAEWLGSQEGVQQQINACVQSVVDHGGIPLQVTVYRDQSPVWTTKYQVIVTAYDPDADYSAVAAQSAVATTKAPPATRPVSDEPVEAIINVAPVLIFLAWAAIVAMVFVILAISVAHVINAIGNVDWEGMGTGAAKAIGAGTWAVIVIAGVLLVGGLLTASGRKRYSEAGEWVRHGGREPEKLKA